jgi:hypothetical protein
MQIARFDDRYFAFCTLGREGPAHSPHLNEPNAVDGRSPKPGTSTVQFKLKRSAWNVSIRQASWAKSSLLFRSTSHRSPYPSRSALLLRRGWRTPENMYLLELIFRTLLNLVKQAWLVPHTIAAGLQQRRGQIERRISEKERLDRIRHPSKYAGR